MALSESDPRNAFGDSDPEDRHTAKAARRASRTTAPAASARQTRRTGRRSDEETIRAVREGKPAQKPASGLYDRLAEQFTAQDWIATHRGNTHTVPTIEVGDTGKPLIAKILRDKVTSEKRFEGRSEEKIEEVMEYAMKHYFDRLDNAQRHGRLVNQFVSSDWWDTLIPEAIDHWHTVRIPPEAFERGRQEAEAFYAAWPKRDARTPRLLIRTDHPNYDDCEELI